MKQAYFTLVIFILFGSSFYVRGSESNFRKVYNDFERKLFSTGKIEFEKKDIDRVNELYKSSADSVTNARIKYLDALAKYYALIPNYVQSDSLVSQSHKVLTKTRYPEEYAKLALLSGMLNRRYKYEYGKSYHWLNEALTMFKELKDTLYLAKTYSQLGVLWLELKDYNSTIKCNNMAARLYRHTKYRQNISYMRCNSYIVYSYRGEYDRAIVSMQRELLMNRGNKDTAYLFILNQNIGENYFLKKDLDSTLVYYNRALSLLNACKSPNIDYKTLSYGSLGELFLSRKQYELALSHLNIALKYSRQAQMKSNENQILHNLYAANFAIGDYAEACKINNRYEILRDSIDIKIGLQKVQQVKYKMELESQQQQAKIDKQKDEFHQNLLFMTICILLLLLIICAFILFSINHFRKMQKIKNNQLIEKLEKEELKSALQLEEHNRKIQEKNREVATTQLLVAEKNSLLNNLASTLQPYKDSKELSLPMWKVINNFIKDNTRKDEEWSKFKIHFDKVHPEFFIKLKEMCPSLTENELHLCSYIRIGGRNKEIAELLSVTTASVTTSRYRIKKKLELGEQSLENFLRRL